MAEEAEEEVPDEGPGANAPSENAPHHALRVAPEGDVERRASATSSGELRRASATSSGRRSSSNSQAEYDGPSEEPDRRDVAGLRWKRLSKLNRGCQEYMPGPSENGLRLRGDKEHHQRVETGGELLQHGMLVRYFNSERRFEHRILKTDKRRSFLYLLKITTESKGLDPIIVRCSDVAQVVGGVEGMILIENNSVRDAYLDPRLMNESTVVVANTNKATETPGFKDFMFFLAPPQANLRSVLSTTVAEANALSRSAAGATTGSSTTPRKNTASTVASSGSERSGNKARAGAKAEDGAGPRETWWRLEGIRVKALAPILQTPKLAEDFSLPLDLRLRVLDEKGRSCAKAIFAEHLLSSDLATCRAEAISTSCKKEVLRLQDQIGGMPASDSVRLNLAVLEVALFHRWTQGIAQHFEGDVDDFLTNKKKEGQVRESNPEMRDHIVEAIPALPSKPDALDTFCRIPLRACITALRQTLDLEDMFAVLVDKGEPQPLPRAAGGRIVNFDDERDQEMRHDEFEKEAGELLKRLHEEPQASPAELSPKARAFAPRLHGKGGGKGRLTAPRLH